ncbi:MAG: hypothetical protein CSA62_09415 [Planctomycetota bacterium]|nr:MAG: hypothetical protein CSA62_09415 [Planctomycetota bacterium]
MNLSLTDILVWYVALIIAMVVHEAAHALVAKWGGDPTAYEHGQVTLNPVPHMRREPFGTIVLPLLTLFTMKWPLGFAHAPYNPIWAERYPKRAAVMASAGPLANLALAGLLIVVFQIGRMPSVGLFEIPFDQPGSVTETCHKIVVGWDDPISGPLYSLAKILSAIFSMNLILGVFNLIPVPPLDGASILENLLPGPLGGFFRLMRSNPLLMMAAFFLIAWELADYLIGPAFFFARELARM